jgi:MFS family permease
VAVLGFLTYASALSRDSHGALGDRFGKRRILIDGEHRDHDLFQLLNAIAPSYQVVLGLVLIHGVFWSGLLSSSSSYMLDIVPKSRRAEGLGYSGLPAFSASRWRRGSAYGSSIMAAGAAVLRGGALNIIMAVIAWRLPPDRHHADASMHPGDLSSGAILIGAAMLFLYSFSYGGITSFVAVYAEQLGVPRALYFTVFCLTICRDAPVHRPLCRSLRPRARHRAVPVDDRAWRRPALDRRRPRHVRRLRDPVRHRLRVGLSDFRRPPDASRREHRRGATFGALIGAFDTGIGTGSIAVGWISERYGFGRAFGVPARWRCSRSRIFSTWRSGNGLRPSRLVRA